MVDVGRRTARPDEGNLSPFLPFLPRAIVAGTFGAAGHGGVPGSLVFADISGFTALSERLAVLGKAGAEELTRVLTGVFSDLLGDAESLGGDLLSFGGDSLLLMFTGHKHPARAARAAAAMRASLRARGAVTTGAGLVRLRISIGIHSGDVLLAVVGTTQRELLVVGPTATTVTQMEAVADADEIVCSQSTAKELPPSSIGASKDGGVLLARMPSVAYERPPTSTTVEALDAYLPAAVRRLVEAGIDEPEHRYVSVGFVLVGGVDRMLAEQGIDDTISALHDLVATTTLIAAAAGVTLLATDVADNGTKLILTSGAPFSKEECEARLLVAARALAVADTPLDVRIGAHAGHVYAGTVGAPWRRVYSVMGDAVNLAARLMAKAKLGEVVASRSLVEAATASFELTALEAFMVKGKRRPQEAYVIGPQIEGASDDIEHSVPFVGRTIELDRLNSVLEGAFDGRGGCIALVGEAGVGKSRLVDEALSRLEGVRVLRATCDPFHRDSAYFASRLIIRSLLGIPATADPNEAGRRLRQKVEATDVALLQWLPLIAATVAAKVEPTTAVDDMDPTNRPTIGREIVDRFLRQVVTQPTAFVFDDAGRMDDASAELFARLALGTKHRPWILCTTSRSLDTGLHPGLGYDAETIQVSALSRDEQHRLATLTGEIDAMSDHVLEELTARAQGNPLYLLELVHARTMTDGNGETPASLEGLIAARIDGLDPVDRQVLRYASVLGTRFPQDLFRRSIGNLVPLDDADLWRRLGRFVRIDGSDLIFQHEVVREVAYDSLPFSLRRRLHGDVANAVADSTVHISDALMAFHYDRAGQHQLAWQHGKAAGERAASTYAHAEAAAQYDRALRNGILAGLDDADLAIVAEALGDASQLAGQFDLATRSYRIARSRHLDADIAMVRLLRKEGRVRDRTGQYDAAVRWYRRARKAASDLPATSVASELADVLAFLAATKFRQSQLRACITWSERALDVAEAAGNRRAEAHACYLLDTVYSNQGRPEAHEFRSRALPIFEELNDFVGQGNVLNNLGTTANAEGRWREASEFFERSRDVQLRAGDVIGMASALHNLGEMRSDQGRIDEAEALLREARRVWRAAGFTLGIACASSGLGRAVGRLGRTDEAESLLQAAESMFTDLGAESWAVEAVARRADALVLAGRFGDAKELVDRVADSMPDDEPSTAILHRVDALTSAADGYFEQAADRLRISVDTARRSGNAYERAIGLAELARLPGADLSERQEAGAEAATVADRLDADLTAVLPSVPWASVPTAPVTASSASR